MMSPSGSLLFGALLIPLIAAGFVGMAVLLERAAGRPQLEWFGIGCALGAVGVFALFVLLIKEAK